MRFKTFNFIVTMFLFILVLMSWCLLAFMQSSYTNTLLAGYHTEVSVQAIYLLRIIAVSLVHIALLCVFAFTEAIMCFISIKSVKGYSALLNVVMLILAVVDGLTLALNII